ncbi:MAG: c-type cytochrome domain-containing protein, partial [Ferruginibacter sp.]
IILSLLSITEFIGHFHPLLVHLPIGILLIALLLQWLSRKERFTPLLHAVPIVLLCGIITSGISCITGYLLSISDDYDKTMVNWHMWMAISVLFVSFLLYLKVRYNDFAVNKRMLSTGLLVLITVTGHLGGSLTHGSGYITKPLKDIFSKDTTANMTIQPLANVQEARVYNDVVRPILQTKCFGCHNPNKQKGGLRMDDINELMKGGKDGKVLQPGNAEASEMIKRLLLPVDNDKHMPPKEKPQPAENQIALLQWWINNGADTAKKVKELDQPAKIKPILIALQQPVAPVKKEPVDVPAAAVEKADEKIMAELKTHGIIILPVAQNSNYLTANFVTDSIVDEHDLKLLQQLKKQLVWLKLDNTNIQDNSILTLAQLTTLTRLSLSNTLLTDKGLHQLAALKNLQYLNLAGTKVTAAGLAQLKPLTQLKNLYLYGTNMRTNDYPNLKKIFPSAMIDSGGYQVPLFMSDTTKVKAEKKY